MLYNRVEYDGWIIHFTICVDSIDDCVFDILDYLQASDEVIESVKHASFIDGGFTYTNYDMQQTLVMIGVQTSIAEFINTFIHELRHVVDDISIAKGFLNDDEKPAYMAGNIAYKLTLL